MPFCASCGQQIEMGAAYCPYCGQPQTSGWQYAPQPSVPAKDSRSEKVIIAVILIVLILPGSVIGYAFYSGFTAGISEARSHQASTTTITSGNTSSLGTCSGLSQSELAANNQTLSTHTTSALYDLQSWLFLTQNYTSLSAQVQATTQNDSFGYGPSFIVNGLSDKGLWYQVGLAYNPPNYPGATHANGFAMIYEVWNSTSNQSIFPSGSESDGVPFLRSPARDEVRISLSFSGSNVVMQAQDLSTGESISRSYPAYGASSFVSYQQNQQYPTSLLNEWYHVVPYLCVNQPVGLRFLSGNVTTGQLGMDEWNLTGQLPQNYFNNSLDEVLFSSPPQSFSLSSSQASFSMGYMGMEEFVTDDTFYTM